MKNYYVYILTTKNNKLLYVGITNNLERRIFEHKNKLIEGYTSKYNINKLVYYEMFSRVEDAISAEKKIKGWIRVKKNRLIEENNSTWNELSI